MKKQSAFGIFLKKFARHKIAMVAVFIILLEVLAVLLLPLFMDLKPNTSDWYAIAAAPSATHLLGTDEIGRDMLARLVYGGRISLLVGLLSTMMSTVIGLPLGVIAGYFQGKIGSFIMRLVDMFMSFPSMVLTLVLVSVLPKSVGTIALVIGILGWTRPCKLLYGSVMSTRSKEYVEAAVAMGASPLHTIIHYILPNSLSPLWVSIAFSFSGAIIQESSLSFLGAGIQAPDASWGNIINAAQKLDILTGKLWMWVPACLILLITVVSINLVGEGLRDALDPKMKV